MKEVQEVLRKVDDHMALMNRDVTVLDFDQTYLPQTELHKPHYEWIDLSDIQGTNRYCEAEALSQIKSRLERRKKRGITFVGSGNFHYISYLLLSEITEPFTLVLFDHHTDMMDNPASTLVSCGSWVLQALKKLSMLKKVILVGVKPDLLKTNLNTDLSAKFSIFSDKLFDFRRVHALKRSIVSEIPTNLVYISVDKDVLSQSDAVTNWDQGSMKLLYLVQLLQYITAQKTIYGLDVCGEQPFSPIEMLYSDNREAIKKNERANLKILQAVSI